jgi:EF-P beta-lysylation protein EpmB
MESVRKLKYLLKTLQLENFTADLSTVLKEFPLLTTNSFIKRIQKGTIDDPLLKQILPSIQELQLTPSFTNDPLNEIKYNPLPGLLHKYKSKALILLTNSCAINCRFCFRKKFPYTNNRITSTNWKQILKYLSAHRNIKEIILSGGDPLILNNGTLLQYCLDLEKIQHIDTLRIHSRIPIVLPSRLKPSLIKVLTATRLKPVLVTHCNHPNEIDSEVSTAISKFSGNNIILLNQSVLLKNINDDAEILIELSKKLFAIGILPYYLHMHDKVSGTYHFYVPISKAKKLMQQLAEELPGYLVPKLVKEVPNRPAKCVLY